MSHTQNRVTPTQIIDLVKRLPEADLHIHEWDGKQCITQEWLVGGFAGRCFGGETIEEAAEKMIDYLYNHVGHNSIVGDIVTESGFPNMEDLEDYCFSQLQTQD